MFKRIKSWLNRHSISLDDVIAPSKEATEQTDVRTRETIKRVRKAFAAQAQQMQSRAMKAHDPSCGDVQLCKKRKCFKWEPDKIVSEPYSVTRSDIIQDEISRLSQSGYTSSMLKDKFRDLEQENMFPSEKKSKKIVSEPKEVKHGDAL